MGPGVIRLFAAIRLRWHYLADHEAFRRSPVRIVLRVFRWRIRCLLRRPATIRLRHWDMRLWLPALWDGPAIALFTYRDEYEPELRALERLLRPGDCLVDAGANYGIYTVVGASLVGPSGRVLAFEPAAEQFAILRTNIELNGLENAVPFRLALSERAGEAFLYRHGNNSGLFSLGKGESFTGDTELVEMRTLDDVLEEDGARRVSVIKLDVEGAEELILRGCSRMLERDRPAIIFEVLPDAARRLGLDGLGAWRLLREAGYRFYRVGRRPRPGALAWNAVAIHSDADRPPWGS
jgi:FkbM family methyltransferase